MEYRPSTTPPQTALIHVSWYLVRHGGRGGWREGSGDLMLILKCKPLFINLISPCISLPLFPSKVSAAESRGGSPCPSHMAINTNIYVITSNELLLKDLSSYMVFWPWRNSSLPNVMVVVARIILSSEIRLLLPSSLGYKADFAASADMSLNESELNSLSL